MRALLTAEGAEGAEALCASSAPSAPSAVRGLHQALLELCVIVFLPPHAGLNINNLI
jgi:hypothetical protein